MAKMYKMRFHLASGSLAQSDLMTKEEWDAYRGTIQDELKHFMPANIHLNLPPEETSEFYVNLGYGSLEGFEIVTVDQKFADQGKDFKPGLLEAKGIPSGNGKQDARGEML